MKLPTISVVVVVAVCIGLFDLINEASSAKIHDELNGISIKSFKVALQNERANFIFSPFGISRLLAMIAREAGSKTLSELELYIHKDRYTSYEIPQWDKDILNIENKIYLDEKIKVNPLYQNSLPLRWGLEVEQLNFDNTQNLTNTINEWIQTDNYRREQFVETYELKYIRNLLLMSVIKFTAAWQYKFLNDDKHENLFYFSKYERINVPFLKGIHQLSMSKNTDLNATIVKLPYQIPDGQRPVSMFIIVPNEIHGLEHTINNIDKINMTTLKNLENNIVELHIPTFKLDANMNLRKHLNQMGIEEAFDEYKARFNGISTNNMIYINQIIQKATININSRGTGITSASYKRKRNSEWSESENINVVNANHPFLVVITAGELILFVGRVTDPRN